MKSCCLKQLAIFMFLCIPALMHAQGGCVDSPEAPTSVLMLVGSIGMVYGSSTLMNLLRKTRRRTGIYPR